jgi:hypothetical protein
MEYTSRAAALQLLLFIGILGQNFPSPGFGVNHK